MDHPAGAERFLRDPERVAWHDAMIWLTRTKRDASLPSVPEWEELREQASQIKAHTLSRLDEYLLQFERSATANGVNVHWAADAGSFNRTVYGILKRHRVRSVVKSKSMLTEESGMNPFLEARGITVTDTDLGEWIVQLSGERPSHIVMPSVHKKAEDVDRLFQEQLGTAPANGDAEYLAGEARKILRKRFLEADAAITGVNFAVAETGDMVVVTNEGNADMGVHHAPLHIAVMGIEKIIPRYRDLGLFLRMLARSAIGQAITSYTSHFRSPAEGKEMHVILVDNGRSRQLGRAEFRSSLACIRCGACANTCPVYRRSGGHSYNSIIPGPIGAILAPNMDLKKHASLPFASTLCGSCSDVCPVKINIHEQLYAWRQIIIREGAGPGAIENTGATVVQKVMEKPGLYRASGRILRGWIRYFPGFRTFLKWSSWGKERDLPDPPEQSFQEWYRNRNRDKVGKGGGR